MSAVAERLRRAYPALTEQAGVGSIPANPDAQNVLSFRRWRLEMKLSPFFGYIPDLCRCCDILSYRVQTRGIPKMYLVYTLIYSNCNLIIIQVDYRYFVLNSISSELFENILEIHRG
jgi:hypothetical protein